MFIKRKDIYYADLGDVVGSEQGGVRPVIIIQNDIGNKYSPTVIVACVTSQMDKNNLPVHVAIDECSCGLEKGSIVLLEQIRTLSTRRLREYVGHLTDAQMKEVDHAIMISVGLC